MVNISKVSTTTPTSSKKVKKSSDKTSDFLGKVSSTETTEPVQDVQQPTTSWVGAELLDVQESKFLSLQEKGAELLDGLEILRTDLLKGKLDPTHLETLSESLKKKSDSTTDPELKEVLDLIEQRVNIELAKRKTSV